MAWLLMKGEGTASEGRRKTRQPDADPVKTGRCCLRLVLLPRLSAAGCNFVGVSEEVYKRFAQSYAVAKVPS